LDVLVGLIDCSSLSEKSPKISLMDNCGENPGHGYTQVSPVSTADITLKLRVF